MLPSSTRARLRMAMVVGAILVVGWLVWEAREALYPFIVGVILAFVLAPIVDRVVRSKADGSWRPGIKAIVVYPMNALANSQVQELDKYLRNGYGVGNEPVTYARYTGQESDQRKKEIRDNPPDILLTNYVMLELMLTRPDERRSLIRMAGSGTGIGHDRLSKNFVGYPLTL